MLTVRVQTEFVGVQRSTAGGKLFEIRLQPRDVTEKNLGREIIDKVELHCALSPSRLEKLMKRMRRK